METLTLFPWLKLEKPIEVDGFRLATYEFKSSHVNCEEPCRTVLTSVRELFFGEDGQLMNHATILQIQEDNIVRCLTDEEITTVRNLSELLAFSGLSCRKYFSDKYWNYDNFQMFLFPIKGKEVCIQTRRRDGYNLDVYTRNQYRFQRPLHVKLGVTVQIDELLIRGLQQVQKDEGLRECVRESIVNYNLANTDSISAPEYSELILLTGAFERLLGCSRGKEDELAKRFTKELTSQPSLSSCPMTGKLQEIQKRFKNSIPIREAWIRDFFRLRNDYAHGKIEAEYPAIWTIQEHLLLSSFVFPLLLKSVLKKKGFYNFRDEDQIHIDSFEKLAIEEHFNQRPSSSAPGNYKWNQIIGRETQRQYIEKIVKDGSAKKLMEEIKNCPKELRVCDP